MMKFKILASFAVITLLTSGCGAINKINTKTKERQITTGLFSGNMQQMSDAVKAINVTGIGKMTKADVTRAGFDFDKDNVECLRGADAMPHIVGKVQNIVDLSTQEKIDAYANTLNVYEACLFHELKTKKKEPRVYWSSAQAKTKGMEKVFIISFKNGLLFNAKESVSKPIDESETNKSWGGNAIEGLIGMGMTGKKFW